MVGIGAVKYADLSLNRESNYKFSYEKMLSLSGNTAPYMLYGYARINGIRRKAQEEVGVGKVVLKEEAERDLARHLALLSATIVDLEKRTTAERALRLLVRAGADLQPLLRGVPS